LRLLLLALVFGSAIAAGVHFDVAGTFDAEALRKVVLDFGPWGWAVYFVTFAAGEFLHVPGLVFVAAGILVYGKVLGFGVALAGAMVSVTFSFLVVRRIGGTPLADVRYRWLQGMLQRLEQHPIRTVFVLRLALWLAPPLNYALALTPLRFRDYLIGSALGLVLPIAGTAWLIDWILTIL
jgi:uncharacterized membrane protein YdjX (TVP38/TMEM64 family)